MCRFLPAPSARRATSTSRRRKPERRHFYPRPPRGGRPDTTDKSKQRMEFLSTPSARRATPDPAGAVVSDQFLSTPSARRATLSFQPKKERALYFYPRPPRGGRRWVRYTPASSALIFIHALREEGDCTAQMIDPELVQFLSTPSARRATRCFACCGYIIAYFYPRPPRGGRRIPGAAPADGRQFLSTPSARRATGETIDKVE